MTTRDRITMALRDVLPIVIAYFPLSATFGVLASASGLSQIFTVMSSVWIYSGGAQFMMIGMISANTAPLMIIATILLVNLRHILYGATVGPYLKGWKEPLKLAAAFGMTDEGYAVISNRAQKGELLFPSYYLTFAFMGYGSWVAGTMVGVSLGGMVTPDTAAILGFALPALFIALLFGGQLNISSLASAGTGALLATIAGALHWSGIGIVLGALIGATVGMMVQSVQKKKKQDCERHSQISESA